jgi:Amt family ammonium transporter
LLRRRKIAVPTLVLAAAVLLYSSPAFAAKEEAFNATNTLWVLIASCLICVMNAGFAFLETGLVRAKNAVNVLSKNYVIFAIATIGFWVVGYGLMFGKGNSFVGLTGFLVEGQETSPASGIPVLAFFFFQAAFAATACSIVSGAVAERIKYGAYLVFGLILGAVIYPIAGHWTWGPDGFLAARGFHDFAGSSLVHTVGGWAALAGILLLGPRKGRYDRQGRPRAIPAHNIPLAVLGGFILWLGWFGFNPGSELALTANVPRIAVTTNLAAAFGMATATATAWIILGKPDITMTINGTLAGLVAITAPCAAVTLTGAAIIGAVAGVLVVFSVLLFDRLRVDDPVGALSVHLVNGTWGTLAVGLFAAPGLVKGVVGVFYGGGFTQLGHQALGALTYAGWSFVGSLATWLAIKVTMGMRVDLEEEVMGLDVGEMGMEAYPQDPTGVTGLTHTVSRRIDEE